MATRYRINLGAAKTKSFNLTYGPNERLDSQGQEFEVESLVSFSLKFLRLTCPLIATLP